MSNQESNLVLKELHELRSRLADLEQKALRPQWRFPRRAWVVLAAVTAVGVGGVALASPVCSNGIPFCFQANSPAQATEVNTNFGQLKTWLETKVGAVSTGAAGTGTVTSGALSTGPVTATSVASSGAVSGGSLSTTGDTTVGGSGKTLSVFGTVQAFGGLTSINFGTTYTAASDGLVTGNLSSNGGTCNTGPYEAFGLVNGGVRGQTSVHGGCSGVDYPTPYGSFVMVVRKGDSFLLTTSGGNSSGFYIPFGR